MVASSFLALDRVDLCRRGVFHSLVNLPLELDLAGGLAVKLALVVVVLELVVVLRELELVVVLQGLDTVCEDLLFWVSMRTLDTVEKTSSVSWMMVLLFCTSDCSLKRNLQSKAQAEWTLSSDLSCCRNLKFAWVRSGLTP